MGILKFILSGEFLFAAFLMAGFIKGGFSWLPVDMTLLLFVITVGIAIKRWLKDPSFLRNTYVAVLLTIPLLLVILLGFAYSPGEIYAKDKLIRFLLITGWAFAGVFVLLKTKESVRKFLRGLIVIALYFAVVAAIELVSSVMSGTYNGTIFVLDTDYLALGRTVGLGIVILLALSIFSDEFRKRRSLFFLLFSFTILVMSGGRMPLLAVLVSVMVLIFVTIQYDTNRKTLSINKGSISISKFVGLLILISIPLSQSAFTETALRRVESLFSGDDESSFLRVKLYDTAWQMFYDKPLTGQGWGTFSLFYFGTDEKVYPHNLFLEMMAEIGLVGLLALLLLFIASALFGLRAMRYQGNGIAIAVFAGFAFCFFNAMTSGDITDNKLIFTFASLMFIVPTILRNIQPVDEENLNKSLN